MEPWQETPLLPCPAEENGSSNEEDRSTEKTNAILRLINQVGALTATTEDFKTKKGMLDKDAEILRLLRQLEELDNPREREGQNVQQASTFVGVEDEGGT